MPDTELLQFEARLPVLRERQARLIRQRKERRKPYEYPRRKRHLRRPWRWVWTWTKRARSFVRAQIGGKVSYQTLTRRNTLCGNCEHEKGGYCTACSCPRWRFARNRKRNKLARWACPVGRFPEEVPVKGIVQWLKSCGWVLKRAARATGKKRIIGVLAVPLVLVTLLTYVDL